MIPMLLAALLGCSSPPDAAPEPAPAPTERVEVAEGGSRYVPAVDPAAIPDGAWMCDMGTVHYAATEAGSCPICGMQLIQKGPEGH